MTLKRYFSVKPCLILIMLITMSNASFDDSPQKIERFRRSPALLNKLSSITPPSLPNPTSMFDSIREEISKIGNMSASLEKALEIEKNARLSLQNFVDSVKDRIETLENAGK
ncbi:DNA polymerase III subunit beta [Folsomia candida]|uniref:DNA polymerase III subunit beta n=1 Tax=Folsomia candida TaxID=158441 RepID=A0A226ENJ4_FOLCA|nr:DNA polymerase III subunit beta [Folsomia candida]